MSDFLIIGDSQAGGAGAALAARLQAQGHKVVRKWKDGGNAADVLALAQQHAGVWSGGVIVFHGGDDGGKWKRHQQIVDLFAGSKVWWYGSSPATHIVDLQLARKVFGNKVTSPDYWLTSGQAAARELRAAELAKHLTGAQVVDWRRLQLSGAVQQLPGVMFPDQPDGIHIGPTTAAQAFAPGNWPPAAAMELDSSSLLLLLLLVWLVAR